MRRLASVPTILGALCLSLAACQAPMIPREDAGSARLADIAKRLARGLPATCACRAAPAAGNVLCGHPVVLDHDATPEAATNGQRIRITRGMVRFAVSDDELAFVLAHEVSHILLGHSGAFTGNAAKAAEVEADRLGADIVARAGFNVEAASRLPLRLARAYPSLSEPHPSYPTPTARFAAIRGSRADASVWKTASSALGACAE